MAFLVALVVLADGATSAAQEPIRGQAYAGSEGSELVVADTSEYPARAVGTLTFTLDGTPGTCTAFLVDQNSVVTAAHCVHDGTGISPDAWSTGLVFDPGHDGATTPYRTCNGVAAHAPVGWRVDADERLDYAVVQLDCPHIGRRVGWFGLWLSGTGQGLDGLTVKVRGYPGDLAGSQWRGGGRITSTTPRLVFHNARTRGDSDGGPLYVVTSACGGPCAVAVQAAEPHGDTGVHAAFAHGPRITSSRFTQILRWAAENG